MSALLGLSSVEECKRPVIFNLRASPTSLSGAKIAQTYHQASCNLYQRKQSIEEMRVSVNANMSLS